MIREGVATLWHEPEAPDRRRWSRWDLLTVPLLSAIVVGEVVSSDRHAKELSATETVIAWPVASLVVGLAATLLLVMRRERPLIVVGLGWAGTAALHSALMVSDHQSNMSGGVSLAVGVYALVRWASGRQILIGTAIAATGITIVSINEPTHLVETILGGFFWTLPVLGGFAARVIAGRRIARIREVRLHERHQLARELHDTVAHHVSAIAIQAQAGRAVANQRPDAALEALAVIEEAASRTLAEMRRMVTVLRDHDQLELEPQRGLADIERLAAGVTAGPRVDVEFSGDLADLEPSIEAGIYRLVQEAVTNARRHARHASRIVVGVHGGAESVQLTVSDDGVPPPHSAITGGFGLIGMEERAKLLGGTLQVGPGPHRGWNVVAELPRAGVGA